MLGRGGLALLEKNSVTLYRNFGGNEMRSLMNNDFKFSLQEGGSTGKDFWLNKEGLNAWKQTDFAKSFNVEIKVESSFFINLPKDAFFTDNLPGGAFNAANIQNMEGLNKAVKSIKILK